MIELGKSISFKEYIKSRRVISTPPEIYALPVGTILQAGRFAGITAHECIYQLGEVSLYIDETRQTAKKDELAIVYRGVPHTINYHPRLGLHKAIYDSTITVTVLGFSNRPEAPRSRKYSSTWAFIDTPINHNT